MTTQTILPHTVSHKVRATDLTIAYPTTGRNAFMAVVHKTGCNHTKRRSDMQDSLHVGTGWYTLEDDWFEVAPCAR